MLSRETLEELYLKQKLSITKIASELSVSKDKVSWWLKKYNIPLRSKQESAYAQHNKIFRIKEKLSTQDYLLMGLGLGLYWGEGNKATPYSVRLGNTDPELIVLFVKFLTDICGVDNKDIKYGLQVFNDTDPNAALNFWLDKLKCTRESFHATISIVPPQGKGTYRVKNRTGVLQVYVNNKRLKEWIMNQIQNMPT